MSYFDKSILKKKKKNNYTSISNDFLQDPYISFEAKGLAASLLSRPEDWEINVSALMSEGKIGRDKVNKIIQELIKAGYMYKSQSRTSGKFSRNILFISDEKDYLFEEVIEKEGTSPLTEKTATVKPVTGEPSTENTEQQTKEYTNTNITNTTTTKKEKSSSSPYEFLVIKEFPLLNAATISNIKRFIPDLTEDIFKKAYSLTEKEITLGKGKDFNAILYKALKGEWSFTEEKKKESSTVNEENKIKSKFEQYAAMVSTCGNFNFAFEEFKKSITKYDKNLATSYLEKFKKLE
ncbi:hypothetical protein C4N20_15830 [Fusobacterium ulcerans]|uniref:Helix-turn-helix domain-containing protein n=1 Tax=Fusobacterium ulcerans TaxID=861 RepID=A0AAX2JCZ4_9FUSO|nr:hypothetical protein [Fusobacterium ulcerans]AVQ29499.1 hypothetical protein C4N20_15830 [Fusobacterium ulcerans]EFS26996.1 hypothetical protein FUAG_02511 [Fusobacterium ulcerans ATCC 49185]SQJ03986.1 Uncharacterised protein [Fusobacterium ulcerans]